VYCGLSFPNRRWEVREMKTSYKTEIEDSVIRNLLSAHKGLADDGKLDDLLKLTKVLWKLRNKIGNKMIEVISEEVEDK
jgi:hypothetical protein